MLEMALVKAADLDEGQEIKLPELNPIQLMELPRSAEELYKLCDQSKSHENP